MRIDRINVYAAQLPVKGGVYRSRVTHPVYLDEDAEDQNAMSGKPLVTYG
ncbi:MULTISPECIES: hypothetical protein [unclassified Mesorhizobium]|nr:MULTISPECIES: hypothetical protein [unclassified Mesorhizobium]